MHQCLPVFVKCKLIVSSRHCSYCKYSCDVDGNDCTYEDNNNNNDCLSYNVQQKIYLCRCNLSTTSSPFHSVLRGRKRKFSIAQRLQSDLMSIIFVVMVMVMLVTRCLYVQGFSPYAVTSETTIDGRIQQRFSTRQHTYYDLCPRQSRAANSVSLLLSRSPVLEQELEEEIISLEWIEFFAHTEKDETSLQQQSQQTPVLFLHGLLGSKRNFATCANMLGVQLDKKRRILGVDLRNHGDTQPWSQNSKCTKIGNSYQTNTVCRIPTCDFHFDCIKKCFGESGLSNTYVVVKCPTPVWPKM